MPLPRLQLFELEDLAWFPSLIRDLATDYLHFMEAYFGLHKPVVPLLEQAIKDSSQTRIVDLCSGAGGPVVDLIEPLTAAGLSLEFTLTDRFPNVNAMGHLAALYPAHIHFRSDPVDATLVPTDLRGLRTIFNAFHHFTPAAARAVLQNAVESRQPICIFEIPERSVPMLLPFFFTPVYVWIATPFIRPFRASRLLFTFLLPLVPLTCWWDGLVSAMRAYTVKEMLALTQDLDGFNWLAGRVSIPGTYAHVTWLRGIPTTSGNSAGLADAADLGEIEGEKKEIRLSPSDLLAILAGRPALLFPHRMA
jgi:hypothetical protein